jgi:hypothetical protein
MYRVKHHSAFRPKISGIHGVSPYNVVFVALYFSGLPPCPLKDATLPVAPLRTCMRVGLIRVLCTASSTCLPCGIVRGQSLCTPWGMTVQIIESHLAPPSQCAEVIWYLIMNCRANPYSVVIMWSFPDISPVPLLIKEQSLYELYIYLL